MEHAEAREVLELAAVEPDGFDRLAAGDTADAAALAGHLAGCAECAAELERLRRASAVVRQAVRTSAPADLRDRTLAFVAAVGRDRSALAAAPAAVPETVPVSATAAETPPTGLAAARRRRSAGTGRIAMWAATIAAGVVIALVATQLLVVAPQDTQIADQQRALSGLARAVAWSLAIGGEADAETVALDSTSGDAGLTGTIIYDPGSNRLVILAQGLDEPPPGMEYRCWVESGGQRTPIGQMFFADDVAFWVGEVSDLDAVGDDATFGVSLSPADDPSNVSADPVLMSAAG
jgi:hypothetical protein